MEHRSEKERTVLVTGATGFLGAELVACLLARDSRPLTCIVRAPTDADASQRGRLALAQSLGRPLCRNETARLCWLCGDVERPSLGLSANTHSALAARTEEIFHCAATTRFDLPLDEARRTNLAGVWAVHGLAAESARRGVLRGLHHVSTAYVAGVFVGAQEAEGISKGRHRFRNTYERTKAEAESFLLGDTNVPTTIYRPSIIVGHSQSGRTTNWNVVYYPMKLIAAGVLAYAPADRLGLLDCVPVDFVADAIVTLAGRDDTGGNVIHLTAGRDALTCEQVLRYTHEGIVALRGTPIRSGTAFLGPLQWWLLRQWLKLAGSSDAARVMRRFEQYAAYTRIHGIFDNQRELRMLAESGVRFPKPSDFFPRAVRYALETDFGSRTPAHEPTERSHSGTEPKRLHRIEQTSIGRDRRRAVA